MGTLYIPLPGGQETLIDEEDLPIIERYNWKAYHYDCGWYVRASPISDTYIFLHREITQPPKHLEVDHADGNGLNNQRSNLRICTKSQNKANCKIARTNKSGFKGVRLCPGPKPWNARIKTQGRQLHLGYYADIIDAAHAYDDAARKYFGEFACVNFPREGERGARE